MNKGNTGKGGGKDGSHEQKGGYQPGRGASSPGKPPPPSKPSTGGGSGGGKKGS